jgi:hypothetical protein
MLPGSDEVVGRIVPIPSPDELVAGQVFNNSVICSYAYIGMGEMQSDTFRNLEYQLF